VDLTNARSQALKASAPAQAWDYQGKADRGDMKLTYSRQDEYPTTQSELAFPVALQAAVAMVR
jgi:hypothetical protein